MTASAKHQPESFCLSYCTRISPCTDAAATTDEKDSEQDAYENTISFSLDPTQPGHALMTTWIN